jgi:Uma2 family endonuclease
MEAKRSRPRWTYAEFAHLPSEGSTRYEVIDGELAVTPAPTGAHQVVVAHLMRILGPFAYDNGLGLVLPSPIDVLFAEGDYLEPDVVFVRSARTHLIGDRGIEGPPDLVIEISSLSTAHRDRGVKLERYRHFGVPEYWIVDLDSRTVDVHRLSEGYVTRTVPESEHLIWSPENGGPALELAVAEILP